MLTKKNTLEIAFGAVFFSGFCWYYSFLNRNHCAGRWRKKYHNYDYSEVNTSSVLYFHFCYPIDCSERWFWTKYSLLVTCFHLAFSSFLFISYWNIRGRAVSWLIMNQIIMILYWQSQLKKINFTMEIIHCSRKSQSWKNEWRNKVQFHQLATNKSISHLKVSVWVLQR
jgi:hypothetical protein